MFRYTDLENHSGAQSSSTAKEKRLLSASAFVHDIDVAKADDRVFSVTHQGDLIIQSSDGKKKFTHEAIPTIAPLVKTPSFVNDILPILSKAGCSSGSCHAKPNGQNGFQLSVFTHDPKSDYREIVHDVAGRRAFPTAAEASLILLKPTRQVAHEGGKRLDPESSQFELIKNWIETGLIYTHPNEPSLKTISVSPSSGTYPNLEGQTLSVTAHFSDDSTRDVTALSHFESSDKSALQVSHEGEVKPIQTGSESVVLVRYMGKLAESRFTVPSTQDIQPDDYELLAENNFIDQFAHEHFQKLGILPSDLCTDSEFIRRAYLNSTGSLPSPTETKQFLKKPSPNKRSQLINQLLQHDYYADFWASQWADLFRPNPDRVGVKSVYIFDQWLRAEFRRNTPFDEFARKILTHQGSNHGAGPAVIYRDRRTPTELTTMFGQIFMGVRLECAKCHHHPFEKWSQEDFYQAAAFFGPVKQKGAGLSPPISAGKEWFYFSEGGKVTHPVSNEVMKPKPLGDEVLDLQTGTDPREGLAKWLTGPNNPFFARAIVNRVWAAYFGQGFVNPVDDFKTSNPPVNEPLLKALSEHFIQTGYDLKELMRTIMNSRIFQLSSIPNATNVSDNKNFSRYYRKRPSAEVMLDAICDITAVSEKFDGLPPGARSTEAWSYKIPSHFMDAFGRPNSSSDPPCERVEQSSVVQSLHMMNAEALQKKLSDETGFVSALAKSSRSTEEIIEELYLACYCRYPQQTEMSAAVRYFAPLAASRMEAIEDTLWALLNSAEFVFDH
jgi:hypothetical protein